MIFAKVDVGGAIGTNYDSDMHGKFTCSNDKRKGVCMAQTSIWSVGFCLGFGSGGLPVEATYDTGVAYSWVSAALN